MLIVKIAMSKRQNQNQTTKMVDTNKNGRDTNRM